MSPTVLTFLGAAGTVTGSRYLLERDGRRILVDCGLFQGLKVLRERNWAPFPVDPASLEAVLLTHAHLDHSGYLPALVRQGFRGPIYCTGSTAALCGLLLPDSAHLEEEAAERANRKGYTKHRPALPLYTAADARSALDRLEVVPFGEELTVGPVAVRLRRAGHILGAAWAELELGGVRLVQSGDLGRPDDPVFAAPEPPTEADVVVLESTYGDRQHPLGSSREVLGGVVRETAARGGVVVIPAFAVGRTQTVLHHLAELRKDGLIPGIPTFIDSPMAADATRFLLAAPADHQLTREQCAAMRDLARITNSVEESKAIGRRRGPMIVISASGMATGGRVLHHLARFAPEPRNTILFAGHQAVGTRGAAILSGAPSVKIHGSWVSVRARVASIPGLSGHADADELLGWLAALSRPPRVVHLTHGEPAAADTLRRRIQEELGWEARVPEHGQAVELA